MIGAGKLADKCASPNAAAKIACEAEVKKYSAMGTPLAASGGFTSELAGDLQCSPSDAFKKALQANQQFAESYGKLASILCLGENSLSVEDVFGKQAEAPVVVAPAAAPAASPAVAPAAPPAAPVLGAAVAPRRSALDEAAEAGEDEDEETPTAAQLEARATELERKAAEKKEKAEELHAEQIELHVAIATDATNREPAAIKWNEFKIAEREAKAAEKAAKKARVEAEKARAKEGAPRPAGAGAEVGVKKSWYEPDTYRLGIVGSYPGILESSGGIKVRGGNSPTGDAATSDATWGAFGEAAWKWFGMGLQWRRVTNDNELSGEPSLADIIHPYVFVQPNWSKGPLSLGVRGQVGIVKLWGTADEKHIRVDSRVLDDDKFRHVTLGVGPEVVYELDNGVGIGVSYTHYLGYLAEGIGAARENNYGGGIVPMDASLSNTIGVAVVFRDKDKKKKGEAERDE